MITDTTITMMAMMAPLLSVMDSESVPEAPASESPPGVDTEPASPAGSPFPGCCGAVVAKAEKKAATEAEDIAGVRLVVVVGAVEVS